MPAISDYILVLFIFYCCTSEYWIAKTIKSYSFNYKTKSKNSLKCLKAWKLDLYFTKIINIKHRKIQYVIRQISGCFRKKIWGSICLPTYPKFISKILYNKCMDILLHVDNCHLFTQFLTCGNYWLIIAIVIITFINFVLAFISLITLVWLLYWLSFPF